ncbi:MAG: hypothetical protein E6005_07545 [Peptostreptococcus sp.]|uniref:hypothetical protein n=1 Tax=Bacillota TaxID=1239 RepID=UPI00291212E9|nr:MULTISPECIES: hypothetical protein [Bacillota]MDU3434275.1 hypothetical protein [Veillonella sp.]MDU3454523.1 hypothetical protein [Peptostreptococcus sp.]MDU5351023.1 hypothetical protein [Peptostreptococcus sp.]MDU5681717.1 hypothetical protein [Peptostreptococcus sp.]MDU5738712.1 hypothetical protein [Peptostreptococcus sp.]
MNLLTNLKANQNQLLEAVLHSVAVEPSQAVAGQVYYNTKDKRAYVYTGTAWIAMDAKDASPTAVSIVKTINDGDSLINMDKIKDLADKLKATNIVAEINGGSENINADRINGIAGAITAGDIVTKINEGTSKISTSKIDGLDDKLKIDTIIQALIASNKTIPTNKITGLDNTLATKITDAQAQAKADTALQQAKAFATQEINKLVNGASSAYDTFKEIEELLKKNDTLANALKQGIADKTGKVAKEIGNGTATEFTVNHNLNSQDVVVMVRENKAPFAQVITDVEVTDTNNVKVRFAKAPAVSSYKVIVVG